MIDGPSATAEAADAPAPRSVSEKAADFENYLFEDEEEQDQAEQDEGAEEGENLELDDEEQEDEGGEPDEPAIEAPASLNAEEKTVFAQLPPEAQQAWAASENRRNSQVQDATTKAAERERAASTKAEQAEALADQRRAAQLVEFMSAFAPQMPDPQLAQHDPASYIAQKAQYDAQSAQFVQFAQQIEALKVEADNTLAQIDTQARAADLMTIGKLADPATRDEYIKASLELVGELGLDPAAFENVASSADFKALEKVADWKAKAEKYDSAMARQMQKVRSAKGKSLRPTGTHGKQRQGDSWDRVRNAKTKSAQASAMAEWLEISGHL